MPVEEEKEEIELDADTIKPTMVKHLETISETLKANAEDLDELKRILAKVSSDRITMTDIETKITSQINFLANLQAVKNQMNDAINTAIGIRRG